MAGLRGRRINYKRNPPLGWRHTHGKKVQDPTTGFWTYEDYLVQDDFGQTTDGRGEGVDRRDDDSEPRR